MKELIIDTSTNLMFVGLNINNEEFDQETRVSKNDHAAYLVDKIDVVLKRNNLKIDDIDKIVVGVGPGSYTGIRVSVMVAKMLAYTKDIDLYGISSLALLSSGYSKEVIAMIDARRSHYFKGTYFKGKEIVEDKYIEVKEINDNKMVVLNSDTAKINMINVSNNAYIIKDVHSLEPNYLRKTEAENNHDQKSSVK